MCTLFVIVVVVVVRLKDGETILKQTVNGTNLKLWNEPSSLSSSPKDQSGVPRKKSSPATSTPCRQQKVICRHRKLHSTQREVDDATQAAANCDVNTMNKAVVDACPTRVANSYGA